MFHIINWASNKIPPTVSVVHLNFTCICVVRNDSKLFFFPSRWLFQMINTNNMGTYYLK
uniref:Uncharacterized protein n=1 Tax=Moniliophthora roreri TaxID=221103 RepID=A0A0W0FFN8_MONRR